MTDLTGTQNIIVINLVIKYWITDNSCNISLKNTLS